MAKYNVGDIIHHKVFGDCEILEVDEAFNRYVVRANNDYKMSLVLSVTDEIPKPPRTANIVAGQYKRKDGTFGGKEYFYKDRSNDAFGGLEVGDIAFAYIKRINRCLPFMITRVDISKEELDDAGISRADLTCLRYTLDEEED